MWQAIVSSATGKSRGERGTLDDKVDERLNHFTDYFEDGHEDERKDKYADMVNSYYDLVTDFYEYGWGQSFHFAVRHSKETFEESLVRHEFFLASQLGLKPGVKVLDIGCGIGGPMRNIARFSGATIHGINNNAYQLTRATSLNKQTGLEELCSVARADFMNLPFDSQFDVAYQIEATCHAPDRTACFKQIFKALKPGGVFGGYEWCVTDKYDESDPVQKDIIYWIEKGDSLPRLAHTSEVVKSLKDAGFEVETYCDLSDPEVCKARGNDIPWYSTLKGGYSLRQFKLSPVGRYLVQKVVDALEFARIAPKGTSETHSVLIKTAEALVKGGEQHIFTPMFFYIARKPADKDERKD